MKIVLIGCDNSGKTTLGSQLSELYNAKLLHSPGLIGREGMEKFMDENLSSDESVIFDRLPIIEEAVYGTLFRGGSVFEGDIGYIKSTLDKVDLFVLCYPGLFTVLNWGDREQFPGVKENATKLINEYNEIAVELVEKGYKVVEYNYRCDDYKELVK